MGQKQSQAANSKAYAQMFDSFSYAPVTTHRTEATYHAKFQNDTYYDFNNNLSVIRPGQVITDYKPTSLIRTAYWGTCMMSFLQNMSPESRIGQCSVYDPQTDSLIIAYGYNQNNEYLNDCWALSLKMDKLEWRLISKKLLSPRSYSSSVLIGRRMYIFGGAYENTFYDDLHYIDIDTGVVTRCDTKGEIKPCPRVDAAMFVSKDNQIFLWGGFDGRSHGSIYSILPDIPNSLTQRSQLEWFQYPKTQTGVPAPAYCEHKGEFYIFGGVTGTPLSKLDPKTGSLIPVPCIGVEPSYELQHASLVSVDEFIFLIGGDISVKYMHIFALDVARKWWFAFSIRPDNESLSISDGIINKSGLFMLPREHSASVIYSPAEREIVSVMGSKLISPPPVFRLKIGDALGVLHLRSDMLDMFNATSTA